MDKKDSILVSLITEKGRGKWKFSHEKINNIEKSHINKVQIWVWNSLRMV